MPKTTNKKSSIKKKHNILMITPYLPRRSQSGGQNSSYYSIKYLAPNNNITLVCYSRDQEGLEDIQQYCEKVIVVKRGATWDLKKILFTGFSTYPFLVTNYISKDLKNTIQAELTKKKYDLIHCECFYLMPNIPKTDIPIVLVDQTIEYAVYEHYVKTLKGIKKLLAPLLWLDVLKLKHWETYYWKTVHTMVAFAHEDQELITKMTGRSDIKLFQNGVDKRYYDSKSKTKRSEYPSVMFGASNMKWMQNRESAEILFQEVWPEIKKAVPDAKLYIVGRYAPDFYGHWASKDVIVVEADADGKKKDPIYYYQYSWVLSAPIMSGGGARNKFFEAMACRLPIITTAAGMGGIKLENGKQSIVCKPEEIASQTISLLKDKKRREEMGKQANLLVKNNYSYESSARGLNDIYAQISKNN